MNRQATDWDKLSTILIFNKVYISRIYKKLLQLKIKTQIIQQKWAKDFDTSQIKYTNGNKR